jgi:hypothetical protein
MENARLKKENKALKERLNILANEKLDMKALIRGILKRDMTITIQWNPVSESDDDDDDD